MPEVEPGKLRRSSKCYSSCNYWLTGPCCLLRQRNYWFLLLLLVLLTFPRKTQQEKELAVENDLIFSSSASTSDEKVWRALDNMRSSLPASFSQGLSSSSQLPQIATIAPVPQQPPPPALKQPPGSARSRSPGKNRGGDHQGGHGHHEKHKAQADPTVVVNTPLGKIRGRTYYINKTGEWVGGFLGVRYAEPPLDQLRFRPPMPLQSLTKNENDIFNATDFGAICIQPAEQKIWDAVFLRQNRAKVQKRKLENYNMSEDCLTLNIYVPLKTHQTTPTDQGLPVFFFIHGGSYYMNAGRLYPGQVLASVQDMIVVTFNYRLGPFGFLSTEDAAAPGNYGLLDQAMALNWVYQNIKHFGGDRSRITLVGNSAGAASVMFHMFSDLSKGKFVGITVQSGCSGAPWAVQLSPKRHAEDLATKLGCPTLPTTELVECIRNFSPEIIMKKAKLEDGLSLAYATVIDGKYGGKFLLDHPDSLIRSRSFYPVPVLTGFTKDEVTIWFTKFGQTTRMKDLRSFVQVDVVSLMESLDTVTQANMAAMIHSVTVQYLYRAGSKENDTFGKTGSISDFISDVGLKAPCIKEMNLLEKFNPKPVFLYEFIYSSVDDVKMSNQTWIGAYHESELQFIFGEAYLNYSNHLRSVDDKEMSDFMMKIWGNFVRYGNPNPDKPERNGLKFTWTNYSEYNQDFAVLGLKSHMNKYFLTDRMLFWNFFFPIFRDYPFRYNPVKPCDEWEIISKSWALWVLLLVTLSLGFALSILIMFRVKRKLFARLRTNNNTTTSSRGSSSGVTTTLTGGSSTATSTVVQAATTNHNHHNHPHHSHLSSRDSINHRHSSGSNTSGSLLVSRGGGQHGNGGGGGGGSSSSSSSTHLLHGANGTRVVSSTNAGGGSNVPINM